MKELAEIITDAVVDREARIRQGKVVSIQAGPPRTLTVDINGTNYTAIRIMDHVSPVVGEGVWILDMGIGRWLAFGSNTASAIAANGQYVLKTGDTMTGNLLLTQGTYLQLGATTNDRIYYYSDLAAVPWMSGPRIIGTNGFSFYNATAGTDVLGYRGVGGTNYAWVATKLLVGSTPSDAVANEATLRIAGSFKATALSFLATSAEALRLSDSAAYISWYNGGSREGYLQGNTSGLILNSEVGQLRLIGASGLSLEGTATGNGTITGAQTDGRTAGAAWTQAAIRSVPLASPAAMTMHNGSTAPVIATTSGTGNNIYFRDANFTPATATIVYGGNVLESSRRYKKNITDWPPRSLSAATERVTDLIAKMRPVSYQHLNPLTYLGGRRSKALMRLNEFRSHRGIEPFEYVPAIHDCSKDYCDGTADNPCPAKLMSERECIGFIAEELHEVFPNAVWIGEDRNPEGIDPMQLLTIALAAIQELTARMNVIEGVT
jgi:hypothetical protein